MNMTVPMKRIFLFLFVCFFSSAIFAQNGTLDARLRSNLFLNVYTNKSTCNVGEPIVVTYKLYSSLESISEVIKDPAFDGFEYKDLVTAGDQVVSQETIDGIRFDVHTIRKVQLTPTITGKLELDPMTVSNRVTLVDASGHRNAILDGINDNRAEAQLTISSVPIIITVNNTAANTKPAIYDGAVGDFKMNVHLSKVNYTPGEEGNLQITISGNGDFSKITQPAVEWSKEVVVLPAIVQNNYDPLNKNKPGSKVFTIPFTVKKTGNFTIMPIQFSYFDAKNNRYNTINNPPLTFYYRDGSVPDTVKTTENDKDNDNMYDNLKALWIGIGILALLMLLLLIIRRIKKRKQPKPIPQPLTTLRTTPQPQPSGSANVDALLQPAANAIMQNGNNFYTLLKQCMMQFFEKKFAVPSALFNRTTLKDTLVAKNISVHVQDELFNALTEIEMNIYAAGGLDSDRIKLYKKIKDLLGKL